MILGGFSKENPERTAAEDQGQEVKDAAVEPPGNTVLVRADSRDLALKTRNNQVDFLVNKLVSEPNYFSTKKKLKLIQKSFRRHTSTQYVVCKFVISTVL